MVHNPNESVSDWQVALQYLKAGNKRYIENQAIVRNTNAKDREILKGGQKPFAVILTCSDSRVPPEIYFDQKLGDIFVIRNAGNIADSTVLGSIEYAVEHLKAPLVVVVGHSCCGAVTGAFGGGEYPENLQTIINAICPAIIGKKTPDEAIHANIANVVKNIKENKIVELMGAKVIGAYYNIESGEVLF
jgi:carbonic anhydrase